MAKPGKYNEPIPIVDNTFETDFFKVKFDMKTGAIVSLFDKRPNKEYVKQDGQLNKLRIFMEDKKGGMKSWNINKIIKEEDVTNVASVKVVSRPTNGQEVPAQKWVDITDGNIGIALLNNTKYGHSYKNGELRLTLMRSAGEPDIYPNLGKFNISYALYPHTSDWKTGVWAEGDDFNVPVYAAEPPSLAFGKEHATRPEEDSFISIKQSNIILSGIKQSEEGNELVVRLVEVEGKATTLNLTLPVAIKSARRLNLIELPLKDAARPQINGRTVKVIVKPHEIVTLGIQVSH